MNRSSSEHTQCQALTAIANAVTHPSDNAGDRRWWTRIVFSGLKFDVVIQAMIPQTLYSSDSNQELSSRLDRLIVLSELESLIRLLRGSHSKSQIRRKAFARFIELLRSSLSYPVRSANANSHSTNRYSKYTEEAVYYLYWYELHKEMPVDLLLDLCTTLATLLPEIYEWSTSGATEYRTMWSASNVHRRLTDTIAFQPVYDGYSSEETLIVDGVTVHLPSAIDALNILREATKVRQIMLRVRVSGVLKFYETGLRYRNRLYF